MRINIKSVMTRPDGSGLVDGVGKEGCDVVIHGVDWETGEVALRHKLGGKEFFDGGWKTDAIRASSAGGRRNDVGATGERPGAANAASAGATPRTTGRSRRCAPALPAIGRESGLPLGMALVATAGALRIVTVGASHR